MDACSFGGHTLTAVDPVSGATGSPRIFLIGSALGAAADCGSHGWRMRQVFNDDFTLIAASDSPNGEPQVGFRRAGDPTFTNLTPGTGGYASALHQEYPVFQPGTNRLWFRNSGTKNFGSVDPVQGASSSRAENSIDVRRYGINASYWFSNDGRHLVEYQIGVADIFSPDGRTELQQYGGESGARIGDTGKVDYTTPGLNFPDSNHDCWTQIFVSANSFLCASQTQLFVYTISPDRSKLTGSALLPESNREVIDYVVSPDSTHVAFVSKLGSTRTLYTVSVQGGEPKKVIDLPSDAANPALMAWTR